MGRDGAGRAAGAEQAHRPGGRVDQHRLVVGVEHDHADAQRVEALAAEPVQPAAGLAPSVDRASSPVGGARAPGRRRTRRRRGRAATSSSPATSPADQGQPRCPRPVHPAIVGSLLTWLPPRTGQIRRASENVHSPGPASFTRFTVRPSRPPTVGPHLPTPYAAPSGRRHTDPRT